VGRELCLWSLRLKGYRILARDYRVPMGEIDILARRGGTLVAIEVKARGDQASASEAITPRQRQSDQCGRRRITSRVGPASLASRSAST